MFSYLHDFVLLSQFFSIWIITLFFFTFTAILWQKSPYLQKLCKQKKYWLCVNNAQWFNEHHFKWHVWINYCLSNSTQHILKTNKFIALNFAVSNLLGKLVLFVAFLFYLPSSRDLCTQCGQCLLIGHSVFSNVYIL